MRAPLDRIRVLQATRHLAERLCLPSELAVLSERGNLIVRFGDTAIVARALYLNSLIYRHPEAWMAREVESARALEAAGCPVAAPCETLAPGPHVVDGVPITLWHHIAPAEETPSATLAATMLKRFHDQAATLSLPLPWLTPMTQLVPDAFETILTMRLLDCATTHRLRREHERILLALTATRTQDDPVIHGDAHAGNLVSNGLDMVWIDLEDVCRGPVGWDLACLRKSPRIDGTAAVAHYLARKNDEVTSAELDLLLHARELEAAVWFVCVAHQVPNRYGRMAKDVLNDVLARIA